MEERKQYTFNNPKKIVIDFESIYILDEDRGVAVFDSFTDEVGYDETSVFFQEVHLDQVGERRLNQIKNKLGIISDEELEVYEKKREQLRKQMEEEREREQYERLRNKFEEHQEK
jgi:hypothetical protein